YVAVLNWFVPKPLITFLAVLETVIESGLAIALLLGIYPRVVAWSSALLLLSFALTMSIALGIVAPLSYSVLPAGGAAVLLGAVAAPRATPAPARARPDNSSRGKWQPFEQNTIPMPDTRIRHNHGQVTSTGPRST